VNTSLRPAAPLRYAAALSALSAVGATVVRWAATRWAAPARTGPQLLAALPLATVLPQPTPGWDAVVLQRAIAGTPVRRALTATPARPALTAAPVRLALLPAPVRLALLPAPVRLALLPAPTVVAVLPPAANLIDAYDPTQLSPDQRRASVPTFLSAAAPQTFMAASSTYLYGAVAPPSTTQRAAATTGPARSRRRPPLASYAAVRGARRVAAVGVLTVLVLSTPFDRVVGFVRDSQNLLGTTSASAAPDPVAPLVPGLVLAANQASALRAAPPALQRVSVTAGGGLTPIPPMAYAAYRAGAESADIAHPGCNLSWSALAGIGELESHHAASGGSTRPDWNGIAVPAILGIRLDGSHPGTARVADTDHGTLDQDVSYDRAVGPMQMLPATWQVYASDANNDGVADPQSIADSAAAAGLLLCAGGGDLSNPLALIDAVRRYNHSDTYVRAVLAAASGYLAASYGPGPEGVALSAIAFGYAHLGDDYQWGGNGPLYDCSGLVQAAYRSAGINLPRTAAEQWRTVPSVPTDDLQPGDLVFFSLGEFLPGLPGHVGIYLGSGLVLDDPHTGAQVRIRPLGDFGVLVSAARPSLLATYAGAPAPGTGFVVPPVSAGPPGANLPIPRPSTGPAATPSATPIATPTPTPVPTQSDNPTDTPTVAPSDPPAASSEPTPASPDPAGPTQDPTPTTEPVPAQTAEPAVVNPTVAPAADPAVLNATEPAATP
jgi:cell wall-associated NlpC family hydrolase